MSFFDHIVTRFIADEHKELTLISHEIATVVDGVNALRASLATANASVDPLKATVADLQAKLDAATAAAAQAASDHAEEVAALQGALGSTPAANDPAATVDPSTVQAAA